MSNTKADVLEAPAISFQDWLQEQFNRFLETTPHMVQYQSTVRAAAVGALMAQELIKSEKAQLLQQVKERKQTYYRYSPYAVVEAVPVQILEDMEKGL